MLHKDKKSLSDSVIFFTFCADAVTIMGRYLTDWFKVKVYLRLGKLAFALAADLLEVLKVSRLNGLGVVRFLFFFFFLSPTQVRVIKIHICVTTATDFLDVPIKRCLTSQRGLHVPITLQSCIHGEVLNSAKKGEKKQVRSWRGKVVTGTKKQPDWLNLVRETCCQL